jgi:hypothetical protein
MHERGNIDMSSSRAHEPRTGFTTTSMRLRREISDILLPQITAIDTFKATAERLATSMHFQIGTSQIDDATFRVDIKYRNPHIGSTVARIHLDQAAGDLQEAMQALLASLSDGWVWHVI